VGLSTVYDFEKGRRAVSREKVQAIRIALEIAGVMFDGGQRWGETQEGNQEMRKYSIAIAAAAVVLASSGALAKELTDAEWHLKFDDCLSIDHEGPNHDGEQFCFKDGKGMSKAQQDAWLARDAERTAARMHAEAAPGYSGSDRPAFSYFASLYNS
jgi:hypothetical protein